MLCNLYKKIAYLAGINKGIILRCTAYQITRFLSSVVKAEIKTRPLIHKLLQDKYFDLQLFSPALYTKL